MPFSFFRPDGPPRAPGSNGSFSSFTPSASYSSNYSRRSTSLSTRPAAPRQPSNPSPALPPTILPTAGTPPRLPFLPTPPSSDIRPLLSNRDAPPPDSPPSPAARAHPTTLHDITPSTLPSLRESRESPLILPVPPAAFAAWESRHPGIDESRTARYEYDGLAHRFIVKCMAGPVHDSFPIYFFRAINAALDPASRRGLQMCTSTDFCNFKGNYEDTYTRKSPDAYVKVAGARGFPSVVVEVGWAESMADLLADARLWLLGTAGQTKVVIVVKFTETADAPSSSSSSSEDTEDEADEDPATDEAALLKAVDKTTRFSALADAILDLHHRGALAKPLLGAIAATFHVFRRSPGDADIFEAFTTTVLPEPTSTDPQPQTYALTLKDLYGDTPVPPGTDAAQSFVMDMADFRRDVAFQVPEMEVKRSLDRAKGVLEAKGFWEGRATFAGAKKAKRKRGAEGEAAEGEYVEKRAR